MDSSKIKALFFGLVAFFAAIYLGVAAANSQFEILVWFGLIGILFLCIWLGRDIWMLIPAAFAMRLLLPWLPGGFPPPYVATLLVLGWSFLLIAMHKLPLAFRFTHVEFAALLVLTTIFQGYVRNPVGLVSMGSDSVGAKPYALIAITTMGAILLASLRVTPDRIHRMIRFVLTFSIFSMTVNLLAYLSPAIARVTGPTLGAFGKGNPFRADEIQLRAADTGVATRIGPAAETANVISRWLISMRNPLLCLTHPMWAILLLIVGFAAMSAGYRNVLIATGLTLAFGSYYWGGIRSVFVGGVLALVAYTLLALINPIAPLPPNVQRSLTILPGPWEQRYKDDAEASTEWRTEMWRLALTTDRYIQNKIFGDGLGMTESEYRFLASLADAKYVSDEMTQERAMVTQAYHSGPVQTVRVTGYVGLIILLYALGVVAVHAHRLITRSRGTPWFGPMLFLCLHMVWHPLFFIFVFGNFGDDVPALFMNMGILRLLEKNLPANELRALG